MISGIVLGNYNGFNTKILLSNLSYDIALTIRQAQVYGISVLQYSSVAQPYGIYVEDGTSAQGNATSFILFSDTNGNNAYDGTAACSPGSECVDKYTIQRGNKISTFCLYNNSSSTCSPNAPSNLDKMWILFKRPNPDAIFYGSADSGTVVSSPNRATITVVTPDGATTKTITVLVTGQIAVN